VVTTNSHEADSACKKGTDFAHEKDSGVKEATPLQIANWYVRRQMGKGIQKAGIKGQEIQQCETKRSRREM
jgi:hypothetical protein